MQLATVRFGSVADPHHTPKAAVRAAGIGRIADLAIRLRTETPDSSSWSPVLASCDALSNLHLLRHLERVVYFYAQVADGAIELGMPEQ